MDNPLPDLQRQPSPLQATTIERVRRQFERANAGFDAHAAVFEQVGERLRERLPLLAIEPARVLDLGCRTGYQLARLRERYPAAAIIGADPAPGKSQPAARSWAVWPRRKTRDEPRIAIDPERLPFADGSFDLVISNLLLPWCAAPHVVFAEVARVLSRGGAFLFTSVGPDTLREYRAAWATIDAHVHVFGLIDMHDLGDAMLGAGFAAPVLDRDEIAVDYPSIDALQDELRMLGAVNLARGRRAGLMAPSVRDALRRFASASVAAAPARHAVTLELVQGHAWKGELAPTRRNAEGDVLVSVDRLRDGKWRNEH